MIICYNQTEKQKVIWGVGADESACNPSKNYYTTEIINNMDCNIFPVAFGDLLKIGKEA